MEGISCERMLQHCVDLYAGRVIDTHAIAPLHVQNQNEEMESFLQDDATEELSTHEGVACIDTNIVSSSPMLPR